MENCSATSVLTINQSKTWAMQVAKEKSFMARGGNVLGKVQKELRDESSSDFQHTFTLQRRCMAKIVIRKFHPRKFHPRKFHPRKFHPRKFHPRKFHPRKFYPRKFHPRKFHPRKFHPAKIRLG